MTDMLALKDGAHIAVDGVPHDIKESL